MLPHKLIIHLTAICLLLVATSLCSAQKQKAPPGGRPAVVVDERLAALRASPDLSGKLVRRLGRGRLVAIRSFKTAGNGIVFCLVNVSSRTHGWIQREAIVSSGSPSDAQRLLDLIKVSADFDRVARAKIFLDHFRRSLLRPEVLLILGDAAELASEKLSRDAGKRLGGGETAPEFSYFLNYSGLDRYNRQGVFFVFDKQSRRLHYDGGAWREIVRRFPSSQQAIQSKQRLERLSELTTR